MWHLPRPVDTPSFPERSPCMMKRPTLWPVALAALALAGCRQADTTEKSSASSTTAPTTTGAPAATAAGGAATEGQERTLAGGLRVTDLKVGSGPVAQTGQTVSVHYTGWLTDGT